MHAYIKVVNYSLGILAFDDQIVIQPETFSSGGDSGSLILADENRAIGLLFAGSDRFTVANSIDRVMQELKLVAIA